MIDDIAKLKSIVPSVKNKLPNYITEEYPVFAEFILKYYEYLESDGFVYLLNQYTDNLYDQDVDLNYINNILTDLGFNIKIDDNIDKKLVYFLVNQFFEMRGSIPSFKLLFRMLFDTNVEISFPRDKLLYPSSASYVKRQFFIFTWNDMQDIPSNLSFCGVKGLINGTVGGIESITPLYDQLGKRHMLIEISGTHDLIEIDEPVEIRSYEKTYVEVNKGMPTINILKHGINYQKGDIINIDGCAFRGSCEVKLLKDGDIKSVEILNGGNGYSVGESVVCNPNNGFYATITEVSETGTILNIRVHNKGRDFTELPNHSIFTERGTGAELKLISDNIGGIADFKFILPYGICDNTTINVVSNKGSGFEAEIKLVQSIKLSTHENRKGFIENDNSYVLDSDSKHEFAYDIKTNISSKKYASIVDKIVHPIGLKVNYIKLLESTSSINGKLLGVGHTIKIIKDLPSDIYTGDELTSEIETVDPITFDAESSLGEDGSSEIDVPIIEETPPE